MLTIPWTNEGRFRDVLDVTWDSLKKRAREATRTSFVERLRNWRDDATWAEFMQRYGRIVRGVAIRAGLRPDEAEDVVQDVFVELARTRHRIPDIADLEAYVFTMLHQIGRAHV